MKIVSFAFEKMTTEQQNLQAHKATDKPSMHAGSLSGHYFENREQEENKGSNPIGKAWCWDDLLSFFLQIKKQWR